MTPQTELQIAQENLKGCGKTDFDDGSYWDCNGQDNLDEELCRRCESKCQEHLSALKRFLDYFIRQRETATRITGSVFVWDEAKEDDIQSAIKLYKDSGIK